MNSISTEIATVLVPLSSAPFENNYIPQNVNALQNVNPLQNDNGATKKTQKNRNKNKSKNLEAPRNNLDRNKDNTNIQPRKSNSKSESSSSTFKFDFRSNPNYDPNFMNNQYIQQQNRNNNSSKNTQKHTVFGYSNSNNQFINPNKINPQDNRCKKTNFNKNNGPQNNYNNGLHNGHQNSTNKNAPKIKMSASQPIINKDQKNFQNNFQPTIYEEYLSEEDVNNGLSNNEISQGKIRINQRSYEDAFISDSNGGSDIYINGLKDRNRALNGDIVAFKLKQKYLWKVLDTFKNEVIKTISDYEQNTNKVNKLDLNELMQNNLNIETSKPQKSTINQEKKILVDYTPLNYFKKDILDRLNDDWFQKTAAVVSIIEKKNSRWAAGHLKLFPDKNKEWALFSPNDSRLPRIKIQINQCPPDFLKNSQFYSNTLFIAQILDIPINSRYAIGELKRCIGKDGNIEVETEAFLIENGIDYSDFKDEVIQSLPPVPWSIPASEFTYRRDLRNHCIFTIDPASARDLDDALHCIKLNEDTYEIGVHIADVSHFVTENSPIDKCAVERTTSVYLVQKVIPMLPRLLCEELCSLNPSLDRLTFSVIWKIKANGDIIDEWFGRTVINSAVKLSYEHAQQFIENPTKNFTTEKFPVIREKFSLNDIKTGVLNLDFIAKNLRQKRYLKGCLALNQTKVSFVLNKELGLPYGYNIYQQKDSNRLVEEFMLLANIAVAHRIYNHYPTKAILRRHPSPNAKQIEQLGESIKSYGFDCDVKSSGSIQEFLSSIQNSHPIASITLTCLLTKTMQLAQYFCSGFNLEKEQYAHYGLAVPLYTHFTSPIRRYPDILVHRLLAATLGYCQESTRIPAHLNSLAENCNDKKYAARVCSEKSSEMFFSLFVNECGPLEEEACVTGLLSHSFDILLVNIGFVKRIYTDKLDIVPESVNFQKTDLKQEISFTWNESEHNPQKIHQTVKLFSSINVKLCKHDSDPLKINITMMHPNEKMTKKNPIKCEVSNEERFYNQRVDIDPYICD